MDAPCRGREQSRVAFSRFARKAVEGPACGQSGEVSVVRPRLGLLIDGNPTISAVDAARLRGQT